jgi:hypothetical protein
MRSGTPGKRRPARRHGVSTTRSSVAPEPAISGRCNSPAGRRLVFGSLEAGRPADAYRLTSILTVRLTLPPGPLHHSVYRESRRGLSQMRPESGCDPRQLP